MAPKRPHAVLDKSRASASPTASQHDNYLEEYLGIASQRDTAHLFGHAVLKRITPQLRKQGYAGHLANQWVDFPKHVGFNNNLSAPKPDYMEGFRRDTFPPTVQELGGAATLVKDFPRFPALPHLAMELKATGANMHLAECQAAYDGAAMVYARNKALNFLGEKVEHGNATVLSAATDGAAYDIFGHYTLNDEKTETTRFYQRCLAQGSLEGFDDFKTGFRRLRNMQDWARDKSLDIRERMTKDHESRQFGSSRPSQSVGSNKSPSNPSDQIPSRSSSDSSEYCDRSEAIANGGDRHDLESPSGPT